jgi:peptidylprolyl isomerase
VKKVLIVCAMAVLAAACAKSGTKSDISAATTTPAPETSASGSIQKCQDRALPKPADNTDMTRKPTVVIPDGAPPCKLVIQDIKVGTGAEAKPGGTVSAQYVGVSWSTHKQFDASWDNGGQPISFSLGQVIAGWQQGIPGMKEGGRRLLIIPPDLGYPQGGPGIAPGETLVFIVDLVKTS